VPEEPAAGELQAPAVGQRTPEAQEEQVAVAEPQPTVTIEAGEATTSSSGAAAVAAPGALAPFGPTVARGEARSEQALVAATAPLGIPDAGDVTIKAAEAETGDLYVAGEAPPDTLLNVYADGELVGEARAGRDGAWLLEAEKEVPAGEVVLRVEVVSGESSAPAAAAAAEMSFMRHPEGIVLEPIVTAMSGEGGALRASGSAPPPTYVIIRRGDNLWRIARRNYGRGIKYQTIFAANRDRIDNPHWIFPGQVFVVPTFDRNWPSASKSN
jgi:nucleoid-associated protein YgaU